MLNITTPPYVPTPTQPADRTNRQLPWWQQFMPGFGGGSGSGGGSYDPSQLPQWVQDKMPSLGSVGGGGGGKKKHGKNSGMPYDAEYRDALLALRAQRATFFDELHRQQQVLRRQFQQSRADTKQQMPFAFTALRNNFAGRGMAHGSGYLKSGDQLSQQFMDALNRLQGDFSFQKGQLLDQRGTYLDNYQTQMDLLRRAATRRLASQAGDLGLGA